MSMAEALFGSRRDAPALPLPGRRRLRSERSDLERRVQRVQRELEAARVSCAESEAKLADARERAAQAAARGAAQLSAATFTGMTEEVNGNRAKVDTLERAVAIAAKQLEAHRLGRYSDAQIEQHTDAVIAARAEFMDQAAAFQACIARLGKAHAAALAGIACEPLRDWPLNALADVSRNLTRIVEAPSFDLARIIEEGPEHV